MEETSSVAPFASASELVELRSRVDHVAEILTQFDKEPPPLPEGDALRIRIEALEGRTETHERRITAHDGLHDVLARFTVRLAMVEQAAGVAQEPIPRDHEHENAEVVETMHCASCGTTTERTVRAAHSRPSEAPCAVCSGVSKVVPNVE